MVLPNRDSDVNGPSATGDQVADRADCLHSMSAWVLAFVSVSDNGEFVRKRKANLVTSLPVHQVCAEMAVSGLPALMRRVETCNGFTRRFPDNMRQMGAGETPGLGRTLCCAERS